MQPPPLQDDNNQEILSTLTFQLETTTPLITIPLTSVSFRKMVLVNFNACIQLATVRQYGDTHIVCLVHEQRQGCNQRGLGHMQVLIASWCRKSKIYALETGPFFCLFPFHTVCKIYIFNKRTPQRSMHATRSNKFRAVRIWAAIISW